MRKLAVFNQLSLDGFFVDAKGDMSWAHRNSVDAEWNAFVADNSRAGGMLVFGRITYEIMAGYWPTPYAMENNPVVAERMNAMPKLVFSRTLGKGRTMFEGATRRLNLKLTKTRNFANGNVLLCYEPTQ